MQLQKTSTLRNLFIFKALLPCANHFFLINHTRKLFWHSNLNEPERKNFVLIIIQLSEDEIQQSSELLEFKCLAYSFTSLISKSLSLILIQNSAPITLNLGRYFLSNWVSTFLEENKFNYMHFLLIQFGNEELKSIRSIWCIVLHDLSWNITLSLECEGHKSFIISQIV